MGDVRIVARGLRKRYGDILAVDGVNFELRSGEVLGLLGPNGAGKTTTIETVVGLRRADEGHVFIDGHDVRGLPAATKGKIGLQLQYPFFDSKIRVGELLDLHTSYYRHDSVDTIAKVLTLTGLRSDRLVENLSTGQRQRLALALALSTDPEILILDEPTLGVDVAGRRRIWEAVRARVSGNRAVLLTTNYMEEAQALCDRIAIIDAGRVVTVGSLAEITHKAKSDRKGSLEDAYIALTGRKKE